jgi:hypothetical protein
MSRTFHHGERRIRVRGIKRDPTDLRRLARALIELAQAQAEAEAEAEADQGAQQTGIAKKRKPRRIETPRPEDDIAEEQAA